MQQCAIALMKNLIEYSNAKFPLMNGTPGGPGDVADLIAFLISNATCHLIGIDGAGSLLVR